MQVVSVILFFYVFGLAAIIMTWYVVQAFIKFMSAKKKEEQANQPPHSL